MLSRDGVDGRLADLGAVLAQRGHEASIVLVGGAALLLSGDAVRLATGDVDVLAVLVEGHLVYPDPLPEALCAAAATVARNHGLDEHWINAVVARGWTEEGWPPGLPGDLVADAEWRTYGGLRVGIAGRRVLIALKAHAVVDRSRASAFDASGHVTAVDLSPPDAQRHLGDLVALNPTDDELGMARSWVHAQEGSPNIAPFLDAIERHVRDARR